MGLRFSKVLFFPALLLSLANCATTPSEPGFADVGTRDHETVSSREGMPLSVNVTKTDQDMADMDAEMSKMDKEMADMDAEMKDMEQELASEVLSLPRLRFATGSSQLKKDEARATVSILQEMLNSGQMQKISITGYADPRGSVEFNEELSLKRAQRVKNYLVSQGVAADSIEVSGGGELEADNMADSRIVVIETK